MKQEETMSIELKQSLKNLKAKLNQLGDCL